MILPFQKKKAPAQRQPRLMDGQNDYSFRRSRTITGSVSNDVKAAAEERSQLKTPRLKLHQLRQKRRTLIIRGLYALVALLIIGYLAYQYIGFSGLIRYPLPAKVKLVKQPPTDTYLSSIHHYLNAHPFEQFLFSVNDKTLSSAVIAEHAEVSAVQVTHADDGLGFDVTLRRPLLSWKTTKGQFYIDGNGAAFTRNMFQEPTLTVTDNSGISPETSGTVVSSRFISFLGQLVAAINQRQIGAVTTITIPPNTTEELDVRLEGRGYDIKTNIGRDPLQEAEDIARALQYFDSKHIQPQYIDVRVAGKAFYR